MSIVSIPIVPQTSAAVTAVQEHAKNPSDENRDKAVAKVWDAAVYALCSVATAGAGSVVGCNLLTVDNLIAVQDWFYEHVIVPLNLNAKGVFECWFSFPDIQDSAFVTVISIETLLNDTWHATRAALGLPDAENPDAVPFYTYRVSYFDGTYGREYSGSCTGKDCYLSGLPAGRTVVAGTVEIAGYQSRRFGALLAEDSEWNSQPSIVWGAGSMARRIYLSGPFTIGVDPNSSPITACQDVAPQWNAIAGELFAKYRIGPAQRAAKQVAAEMQQQLSEEMAANGSAMKPGGSAMKPGSPASKTPWGWIVGGLAVAGATAVFVYRPNWLGLQSERT